MKDAVRFLATCALLAIAALPAMAAAPRDSGQPGPMETLPQSVWEVSVDGVARHLQSGLECPTSAAEFLVNQISLFDPFGLDVGCNYVSQTGGAVTIYLTKRERQSLEDDLARADFEITNYRDGAEPYSSDVLPEFPQNQVWLSSLYRYRRSGLVSGIWITDISGWTLKFRATYPEGRAEEAFTAMAALIASAEPSRAHLAACAFSPPPDRTGERITDGESLGPLALGAAMAALAEDSGNPNLANPFDGAEAPIWCVEEAEIVGGYPLVFWRNMRADGQKGPADRVTPASSNAPVALEIIADRLGTGVQQGRGLDPSLTVYVAAIRFEEKFESYAFFAGRPNWMMLSEFAARVFTRTSPLLSAVDKATRRINWAPQ